MVHTLELPYLVSLDSAKEWLSTLRYATPEEKEKEKERLKEERKRNFEILKAEHHAYRMKAYEAAEKINPEDYKEEWFYCEHCNEYFEGFYEYCEYLVYSEGLDSLPDFVWAAKLDPFYEPTAEDLLCEYFEDYQEDCWDTIVDCKPEAVEKLDLALKEFHTEIKDMAFHKADYSRAIPLKGEYIETIFANILKEADNDV